jgi:hypothetical protein
MGFFKKAIKKATKPVRKTIKHTRKVVKASDKARKAGNAITRKAIGGGKGKHRKAGTRSGGKRAAARNARVGTPSRKKVTRKGHGSRTGKVTRAGRTSRR